MIGLGDYKLNPKGMIRKAVDADPNGVTVVFDSLPDNAKVYVYHAETEGFNPAMIAQLMQMQTTGSVQSSTLKGVENGDVNSTSSSSQVTAKLQDMNNSAGGFGLDASGSWEPQANIPGQIINFKLYYLPSKKENQ